MLRWFDYTSSHSTREVNRGVQGRVEVVADEGMVVQRQGCAQTMLPEIL